VPPLAPAPTPAPAPEKKTTPEQSLNRCGQELLAPRHSQGVLPPIPFAACLMPHYKQLFGVRGRGRANGLLSEVRDRACGAMPCSGRGLSRATRGGRRRIHQRCGTCVFCGPWPCSAPADQKIDGHAGAPEPNQTETEQGMALRMAVYQQPPNPS
jgi:hypothetical protein